MHNITRMHIFLFHVSYQFIYSLLILTCLTPLMIFPSLVHSFLLAYILEFNQLFSYPIYDFSCISCLLVTLSYRLCLTLKILTRIRHQSSLMMTVPWYYMLRTIIFYCPISSIGECVMEYHMLLPSQTIEKWIPFQNSQSSLIFTLQMGC